MSRDRLSAAQVKTAAVGLHADGGGLYLQVTNGKSGWCRSWLFRFTLAGRQRYMGLGAAAVAGQQGGVSLADARAAAESARSLLREGIDPIDARNEERKRKQAEADERAKAVAAAVTFQQAFETFFADRSKSFSNTKHAAQWRSTLKTHAHAILDRPVADIGPDEILDALRSIWLEKPETARRTLNRIDDVFKYAIVKGFRKTVNPCTGVPLVLGKNRREVEHLRALHYAKVPEFLERLRQSNNNLPATRMALEWLTLTATRSGETRLARWREIDEETAEWRIPPERMKAKKLHIVPLSSRCLEILHALKVVYPHGPDDLLFPNIKAGALSDTTLTKVLSDMGLGGQATVHGMRSAFRDWTTEVAKVREVVAEAALAHIVPNKTEKAYRRGTYFDERKVLMQAWATFCGKPVPADTVVRFPERAAT